MINSATQFLQKTAHHKDNSTSLARHLTARYIPDKKVVGLSKIPRLVDMFARRLQIQEQLTEQIADALSTHIGAKGVGVVIEARHFCMQMRGVQKANATTTTSALRGLFLKDEKTRKEFFALINAAKQVRF